MTLNQYIFLIIMHLSPLNKPHQVLPGSEETLIERELRYHSIADDITIVVITACEHAKDELSCELKASRTLAGIGHHESDFAKDVDSGKCYRGKGHEKRCDGGNAHSIWQVHSNARVAGLAMDQDRKIAGAEALFQVSSSIAACRKAGNSPDEQLAGYAGGMGNCSSPEAKKRSKELMYEIRKAGEVRFVAD